MIAMWNRLTLFTRILAVVVFVSAVAGAYTRLRWNPQQAALELAEKDVTDLGKDVRHARDRVDRLEREAELARRWSAYARVLEEQSTGRSLRDVIRTCGTERGPAVDVRRADFRRRASGPDFARLGVKLSVRGDYDSLIDLLDELDRTFPPIEVIRATLARPEKSTDDTAIEAELEGIIHETR
ncbi:MAG TPA: hypothetical protein VKA86_00300 [Candidatus Krumholzibacteria bacterium]|nr:hypothetical protein [Candidatus Krumholzibacteria bacterium]